MAVSWFMRASTIPRGTLASGKEEKVTDATAVVFCGSNALRFDAMILTEKIWQVLAEKVIIDI